MDGILRMLGKGILAVAAFFLVIYIRTEVAPRPWQPMHESNQSEIDYDSCITSVGAGGVQTVFCKGPDGMLVPVD